MLMVNQLVGFGANRRGPVTLTWTATTNTGGGSSSPYTSSSQSFGTEQGDRIMVVGVVGSIASSGDITAVSIGGVAGTRQQRATVAGGGGANLYSDIWTAAVPTGATGTVVVTFTGGGTGHICLSIYAMYGAGSATPSDTTSATASGTDTVSANLTVDENGAGLGVMHTNAVGSPSTTWTNLTEDADTSWIANAAMSSASTATPGTSSRTATSSLSGTQLLSVAAWTP